MNTAARKAAATGLVTVAASVLGVLAWQNGKVVTSALLALTALAAVALQAERAHKTAAARRRTEYRELAPSDREQARNRVLLDHAPVPVLFETAEGSLHAANRAARELFGTEDRVRPDPTLLEALREARPGERAVVALSGSPRGAVRADTGLRRFALTVAPTAGGGGLTRLIALADVDAELHLVEARVMRSLMEVLSHEIMNSLTPIVSLSETAVELLAATPEQHDKGELDEALATVLRRARGLEHFVQGYRRIARIPTPRLARTDLREIMDNAARIFRSRWAPRVALSLVTPEHPVLVRLDAELIDQALLNVLNNAAEAALSGVNPPRVELRCTVVSHGAAFEVLDNGTGIAEDAREAIFRPFFSLKPQGSGVGLSVARQVVLAHGGDITLGAAPTDWSTMFIVTL